jgi:hypothetical protein
MYVSIHMSIWFGCENSVDPRLWPFERNDDESLDTQVSDVPNDWIMLGLNVVTLW